LKDERAMPKNVHFGSLSAKKRVSSGLLRACKRQLELGVPPGCSTDWRLSWSRRARARARHKAQMRAVASIAIATNVYAIIIPAQ